MPIYEYGCLTCGADFEKLMKMDAPQPPCPECGAIEVQKKVSASGFVLKGSGWYRDHYGLKKGGGTSEGAKSESSEAAASSATSSETSASKSDG
jgi:putative FmdB family regulatory protein